MKLNFQLIWTPDANFTMRVLPTLHPGALGSPTAPDAWYPVTITAQAPLQPLVSCSRGACSTLLLLPPRPAHLPAAANALEEELGSQMLPLKAPPWLETA